MPSIAYTIKVNNFKDANGNAVVPFSSSFTTGSTAAAGGLTLVSTNIPFGATGVSNTQPIILTFSQILDPTTVNSNTLLVMNSWNSNYGLAGTYTVSGAQVTFTPTAVAKWVGDHNCQPYLSRFVRDIYNDSVFGSRIASAAIPRSVGSTVPNAIGPAFFVPSAK